jgi:ubiquitin-protein ligase
MSICALLADPNPHDPLSPEIAKLYFSDMYYITIMIIYNIVYNNNNNK